MKEILRIEDRSKATGCKFKLNSFNTEGNITFVINKYNELQRTKARLNETRNSVRVLEKMYKEQEEEFRLLEPLIELEFDIKEKEWETTEINGAVINSTDYRNTNI